MKNLGIKIALSIFGVGLALAHIKFPMAFDLITVLLLFAAVIPWIESLFKSVKIPGGLSFEFRDLERIGREARKIGLISSATNRNGELESMRKNESISSHSNHSFVPDDSKTIIYDFRNEIESSIKRIAVRHAINSNDLSTNHLIYELKKKNILDASSAVLIQEILDLLIRSRYNDDEDETITWIESHGVSLLDNLDKK
jgi:hypothetical protein